MILKNTNNFSIKIPYGTYFLTLSAGATINVQEYIPENLPNGVIILEKTEHEMITEPFENRKKVELESIDNSKLLLG